MSTADANQIRIEYNTFGHPSSPALLLIIGIGCQMIHWPSEFCQRIADRGYYVIRYDNRDSGCSAKIEGLSMPEILEKIGSMFMGQDVSVPYTIEDMAADAAGLLDALNIDRAHICGMSMGGFIAQAFAIAHPWRTLSLTSIYSHNGDKTRYLPAQEVMEAMLTPIPEDRTAYIEHTLDLLRLTFGTGLPFDEEFYRPLTARSYDRCFCPEGTARQYLAIMTQTDRTPGLQTLNMPALVIHGEEDPLVPMAGGEATADAIPGAEWLVIPGMGHVLPNLNAYWSDILKAILNHLDAVTS